MSPPTCAPTEIAREGEGEDRFSTIRPAIWPPVESAAALEHEQPAEDAEDRARGADGDRVRAPEERACRRRRSRDEIEEQEAPAADHLLEDRAGEVEASTC